MLRLVWSSFDGWCPGWRERSLGSMSAGERGRLARMRNAGRAGQFLAGRLLARQLVSEVSGLEPRAVALAPSAPTCARDSGGTPLCQVSISHSGSHVAVALGTRPVGVDCEGAPARRNWREIAAACFSGDEMLWLQALPAEEAAREFVRLWTTKEAVSKCSGLALLPALARVEVMAGTIRLPSQMRGVSCWSGDLADSLALSLAAEMEPALAPAQVDCRFRTQPDREDSATRRLTLLANRA